VNVGFHPAAGSELQAAANYYESRVPGLGGDFLIEIEGACSRLSELPLAGSPLDAEHRRFGLRRFPFGLIYRITSSGVQIIAVAHRRRRPGYWRQRK
jgi:plasmid stabilization system protein ParE